MPLDICGCTCRPASMSPRPGASGSTPNTDAMRGRRRLASTTATVRPMAWRLDARFDAVVVAPPPGCAATMAIDRMPPASIALRAAEANCRNISAVVDPGDSWTTSSAALGAAGSSSRSGITPIRRAPPTPARSLGCLTRWSRNSRRKRMPVTIRSTSTIPPGTMNLSCGKSISFGVVARCTSRTRRASSRACRRSSCVIRS